MFQSSQVHLKITNPRPNHCSSIIGMSIGDGMDTRRKITIRFRMFLHLPGGGCFFPKQELNSNQIGECATVLKVPYVRSVIYRTTVSAEPAGPLYIGRLSVRNLSSVNRCVSREPVFL